jgi:hypothetical protein
MFSCELICLFHMTLIVFIGFGTSFVSRCWQCSPLNVNNLKLTILPCFTLYLFRTTLKVCWFQRSATTLQAALWAIQVLPLSIVHDPTMNSYWFGTYCSPQRVIYTSPLFCSVHFVCAKNS